MSCRYRAYASPSSRIGPNSGSTRSACAATRRCITDGSRIAARRSTQCLKLYREHRGESLTYPVPQDAATAALALLPTVSWLLGDPMACEDAIREGLAHVERLDRDFDRALLHAWIAGVRYTQRRYADAATEAMKAVAISQQHGYREWLGTGMLLLLMAQCALQPSASAMEQATAVCLGFEREGVGLNASYYLWGLARGYAQLGELDKARFSLAKAFQCAQASAESRMNPELMILQAELESDRAVATRLLDDALALAETQGAVATALRAAATLVLRTNADPADAGEARATLDLLDCRECYPAEPGWMRARLDALRAAGTSGRRPRKPASGRISEAAVCSGLFQAVVDRQVHRAFHLVPAAGRKRKRSPILAANPEQVAQQTPALRRVIRHRPVRYAA